MDKYKLEYFIRSNGYEIKSFFETLEMSKSAFYRKCNGKSEFTREEISKIAKILHLTGKDILEIFFAFAVS